MSVLCVVLLPVFSGVLSAVCVLPSVLCRILPPVDSGLYAEDGENYTDDVADEGQSDEKCCKEQDKEASEEMHNKKEVCSVI